MLLKEKHKRNICADFKFYNNLKDLKGMFLFMVFLFVLFHGFATETVRENTNATTGSKIVYSVSGGNAVVITEGKITANEGQTIQLLPGTNIKSGEELTVNIASKVYQEAINQKDAKKREEKLMASVVALKEALQLPSGEGPETVFSKHSEVPGENASFGKQGNASTALLLNTSNSITAPTNVLHNKNNVLNMHNLRVLAFHALFSPTSSWGELAKTIKVMRC